MSLLIPIWRCLHLHSVWKAKAGEHHEVKASLSYVQTTDWDCFSERTATAAWVTILTAGSFGGASWQDAFLCSPSSTGLNISVMGLFLQADLWLLGPILFALFWHLWVEVPDLWLAESCGLWVVSFTSWAILSLYLLKYSLGPLVPRLLLRAATPASSHAACRYSEGLSPFSLCGSVSLIFVVQLFLLAFLPARYPFSLCHICHL